jgi:hypothetical protein
MTPIPLIERREIEAQMAAALIERFAAEIGPTRAVALTRETIQGLAENAGRQAAALRGSNTLEDLAAVVRDVWAREDALQITVHKATCDQLAFDVHRCRYVEMYDRLGLREMGFHLSCCRDAAFARGFNTAIRLQRRQTIMEGAPCCDFRFSMPAP